MEETLATQVLGFLSGTATTAGESLQEWSIVLFTLVFVLGFLWRFTKKAVAGEGLDQSFFFGEALFAIAVLLVIIGYFALSMGWVDTMRQAGMALSGSSAETVDVGQIAATAGTVNERIEAEVDRMRDFGWVEAITTLPEAVTLMVLSGVIYFLFAVIALISIWLFAKFILGYMIGGVVIGTMGLPATMAMGMKSVGYVIFSAMPLFLLAFLQGLSEQILNSALWPAGEPATLPVLGKMIFAQAFLVLLAGSAAVVPKEFLMSAVGAGGGPSGQNIARNTAMTGAAIGALGSAGKSMITNLLGGSGGTSSGGSGSGGKTGFGSGALPTDVFTAGGGGSSSPAAISGPSSNSIPRLTFSPKN